MKKQDAERLTELAEEWVDNASSWHGDRSVKRAAIAAAQIAFETALAEMVDPEPAPSTFEHMDVALSLFPHDRVPGIPVGSAMAVFADEVIRLRAKLASYGGTDLVFASSEVDQ